MLRRPKEDAELVDQAVGRADWRQHPLPRLLIGQGEDMAAQHEPRPFQT
jgi:hypothetical protein